MRKPSIFGASALAFQSHTRIGLPILTSSSQMRAPPNTLPVVWSKHTLGSVVERSRTGAAGGDTLAAGFRTSTAGFGGVGCTTLPDGLVRTCASAASATA